MDKIVLNITPKPLPRARVTTRGGFGRSYYPKSVMETFKEYDWEIKKALMENKEIKTYLNRDETNPPNLKMEVVFYMPIPKSLSVKKRKALNGSPHFKTPDLDNLVKMLLDRLDGKMFENDKFLYEINSKKIYSDEPRIEFKISETIT